jgi:hypothetical protein
MKPEDYFYWPLFEALLATPEGLAVGFVLLLVVTCAALCWVGMNVLLIGARR